MFGRNGKPGYSVADVGVELDALIAKAHAAGVADRQILDLMEKKGDGLKYQIAVSTNCSVTPINTVIGA